MRADDLLMADPAKRRLWILITTSFVIAAAVIGDWWHRMPH